MMDCTMLRWYLVHTKPSREAVAQENLERQNFEVYYPRLSHSVRWRHRLKEQVTALFPRYLFLRLDEGRQSLGPVHSTVGVTNVVQFGLRCKVVPDDVIRELRKRADLKTGLHHLLRPTLLNRGAKVRITAGPFDGLEGIFQRETSSERVVILLKILGQDAPVRVPSMFIQSCLSA
jgi:transcriptional antiterminator RfaH